MDWKTIVSNDTAIIVKDDTFQNCINKLITKGSVSKEDLQNLLHAHYAEIHKYRKKCKELLIRMYEDKNVVPVSVLEKMK